MPTTDDKLIVVRTTLQNHCNRTIVASLELLNPFGGNDRAAMDSNEAITKLFFKRL